MNDSLKNKSRVPAKEFESRDYALNTAYFITICTKDKELLFGNILKGKMQLSQIGELAENFWKEIPKRYPHVELDAFVVMPNHIHGIILINKKGNQKELLSSIMGSYKAVVLKSAKIISRHFAWKTQVYEQLIKDSNSHENIANYIINNSFNWRHDKFYKS